MSPTYFDCEPSRLAAARVADPQLEGELLVAGGFGIEAALDRERDCAEHGSVDERAAIEPRHRVPAARERNPRSTSCPVRHVQDPGRS